MLHAVLVEDDEHHAKELARVLEGVAAVTHVRTDGEVLALLGVVLPDLVVTDLRGVAPGASPIDYVASLRAALDAAAARARSRRPVPIVLASGLDPVVLRGIASTLTHTHALPKPHSPRALRELVTSLTS